MKKPLHVLSFTCLLVGLTACSSGVSSSSASSESSASFSQASSTTSSSSSVDPYKGRIKSAELNVLDLIDAPYRSDDPEYYEDAKTPEQYYRKDKLKMYYLDDIDDSIYYIDVESFGKLLESELSEGYAASSEDHGSVSSWTVKKGEEVVFRITMDAKEETLSLDGELDSDFLKSTRDGISGETARAQIVNEYMPGHENITKIYPFGQYGFDFFQVDGKHQYPFALFSLALSLAVERGFVFNTPKMELVEFGSQTQFETGMLAMPDGDTIAPKFYVANCHSEAYGDKDNPTIIHQPQALTAFNKKLFYFLMDNFYGMASQKGIRSMSNYFEGFEYSANFLSDDSETRFNAYGRAIDMLNDMHSGVSPSHNYGEGGYSDYHYEQSFQKDRVELNWYLSAERAAAYKRYNAEHGTKVKIKDMLYSNDGKYGFFSFDGFDTYNHFPEEGEPIPEKVFYSDTFNYFVRNLEEAKAKGVKRIIIDDTLNGGGYVTIMAKLLALMSKDNKSEVFLRSDDNDAILRTTTRVDSNDDGKYDLDDCYGNDFKFYILTSNYSFSCGNAFPFYAKRYNLATIIGGRSGGGECCVFEYTLPSGMHIRYSSPYHVGYYDEENDKYYGDERGGIPDIGVAKNGFCQPYDVDALGAYIDAEEA